MTLWRPMRDIHLAMPEELLVEIDEAAKESYMSRSEYIRHIMKKEVAGKYPNVIDKAMREDMTRFADLDDS
jgi:metal-responsive CopG/Arc/MetJ family transcriptional regulator